jgi:hypothetical protein
MRITAYKTVYGEHRKNDHFFCDDCHQAVKMNEAYVVELQDYDGDDIERDVCGECVTEYKDEHRDER